MTVWFSTGWNLLALLPVSDVTDGFIKLQDDENLPKNCFLSLKCSTSKEKEAEGLEGSELNPHVPQNFGNLGMDVRQ